MADTKRTMEINGVTYEGCYHAADGNEYYCISPDGTPIIDDSVLRNKWHNARRAITLTLSAPSEEEAETFWEQPFLEYATSAYNSSGKKFPKNSSYFDNRIVYISYHRADSDGTEQNYPFALASQGNVVDGFDLWWVKREFVEYFAPGGNSSSIPGGAQIYYNGKFRKATPYILKDGVWRKATPYILKDGIWNRCI